MQRLTLSADVDVGAPDSWRIDPLRPADALVAAGPRRRGGAARTALPTLGEDLGAALAAELGGLGAVPAQGVAARMERGADELLVLTDPGRNSWAPLTLPARPLPDRRRRVLLLLHGTARDVRSEFAPLVLAGAQSTGHGGLGADRRGQWLAHYDAVVGFDHRSLTRSPADNAIALVGALRQAALLDAQIDVIRRMHHGSVLHYPFSAVELLTRLAELDASLSLQQALQLREEDASLTTDGVEHLTDLPQRAVLAHNGQVVGVIPARDDETDLLTGVQPTSEEPIVVGGFGWQRRGQGDRRPTSREAAGTSPARPPRRPAPAGRGTRRRDAEPQDHGAHHPQRRPPRPDPIGQSFR